MKNFKITAKEDGKEYWISRAIAVVGIIIVYNPSTEETYYLVSRRGKNCPDFVGKWQCTCGYLDFDETTKEGIIREIWEELGLDLSPFPDNIKLIQIIDDPLRDSRQNVSFRFIIILDYDWVKEKIDSWEINSNSHHRGGEVGEIEEIKLIPSSEIDNYEWAFNHHKLLTSINNGSFQSNIQ